MRWAALSGRDKRRLLALTALLPAIDLALRTIGLRGTQRLLGLGTRLQTAATKRPTTDPVVEDAQQLAQLASIAGRHGLYANTCLRQALAVQWWLRRRGLPARLRIGARRTGDGLDAHAWVELAGVPLAQGNELPPAFF